MAVYERQPLYIKEPPNDPFAGWRALQFRYFQENRGGATGKEPTVASVKERRGDALAVSYRVKGIRPDGGDSTTGRAAASVDEREGRDGGSNWRVAGLSRRPAGRRVRRVPPPPGIGSGSQLSSVQTTRPPQLEYVSLSMRLPPAGAAGGRSEHVAAARPVGGCGAATRDDAGRVATQQCTPDVDSGSGSSSNRAASAAANRLRGSLEGRDSSADADYSAQGRTPANRGDIVAAARRTPTDANRPPDAAEHGERRKTVVSGAVRLSALIPRDGRGGGGRTAHWRQQLNSFRLHGGEVGGSVVDEAAYEQYARRRAIR